MLIAKLDARDQEILERFAQVVATSLRIDPAQVTPEANLADLGAESLDLLEITMDAEEEFNILIPQKNILQLAQDVFGAEVLVRDGRLTEEGRKFFAHRMPEVDPSVWGELTVAEFGQVFLNVTTWVRMIRGLMDNSPHACPQCGAPFGKAVAGRVKCASCAIERDLPSGDDLNRRWVQQYYEAERGQSSSASA